MRGIESALRRVPANHASFSSLVCFSSEHIIEERQESRESQMS